MVSEELLKALYEGAIIVRNLEIKEGDVYHVASLVEYAVKNLEVYGELNIEGNMVVYEDCYIDGSVMVLGGMEVV